MAVYEVDDYSGICEQLDNLAVQILNVMQNIISERQYMEDNLKEGYINMAKSRYLMSGRKISILQINTADLNASKKVVSYFDSVEGVKYNSFRISNRSKSETEKLDDHSHSDVVNRSSKLRTSNTSKEEIGELQENFCDTRKSHTSDNPLRWFGVLLPESLKICQSRFEQVIETSAKIASFQNQLKVLSEEYRRLRKRKHVLNS